jgi:hypothetical protein
MPRRTREEAMLRSIEELLEQNGGAAVLARYLGLPAPAIDPAAAVWVLASDEKCRRLECWRTMKPTERFKLMTDIGCATWQEGLSTAALARRAMPGASAALIKKIVREYNRYYDKLQHELLQREQLRRANEAERQPKGATE